MNVHQLLEEMVRRDSVRVPPYPSTALKVRALMATGNYGMRDLTEVIRVDQAFTLLILRLANSPFYRRGAEVTSLEGAVARVGARELGRLALAASVSQTAQAPGFTLGWRRKVWREALSAALVCEALAAIDQDDPGEAFVMGLLHDVGGLLVLGALEELLPKHPELASVDFGPVIEREHVTWGVLVCEKWQLPEALARVVALHHEPVGVADPALARVVFADRVVKLMESQLEVTAEQLVGLGLPAKAAAKLADIITHIPAMQLAYEGVERADTCFEFGLGPEAPEGPHQARCERPDMFCISSDRAFTINRVVEVVAHVAAAESLRFWAVVHECRAAPTKGSARYELELSPFALSPSLSKRWAAVLASPGSVAA